MKAFSTIACLLALATPTLAGFPQPTQHIRLQHGQHAVKLIFKTDGSRITKAKAHCDCTTLRNEGTQLIAIVDTSTFDSQVEKTIDATTDDGKTTRLRMRFSTPQAIVLSSRSLIWKIGSKATPKKLTITLPKGSPVKDIIDAGLNGTGFDYKPAVVQSGRTYTVTVTPLSTDKPLLNRLVIKTDCKDPRYAKQIIYLQIKK